VNVASAGPGKLLPWGGRRGGSRPQASPSEADRDRALLAGIAARDPFELWERSDRFDASRSTPLAYLTTLTRSRAIDRLRRERRRISVLDVARRSADAREQAAPHEGPLAAAQASERGRLVGALLDALDRDERHALELSFFAGLSHSEIAARLEQPLGTVKTRIRRALARLREWLEEHAPRVELP
jgi:RNA polymerase sigma-70 factor (ECF subfamily)